MRLKSSWHRRRRSKILAVSLKHWKGTRGGGGVLLRCTAVPTHHCPPAPPYTLALAAERLGTHRAAELSAVSVTGVTRASMRLPSARLEPYADIRPCADSPLASRAARLAEVTEQANYVTQDRFIAIDPDRYAQSRQRAAWDSIDFAMSLPVAVFQGLLRASLDPGSPADQGAYAAAQARMPLLTLPSLAVQVDRGGSLVTSLDNVPAHVIRNKPASAWTTSCWILCSWAYTNIRAPGTSTGPFVR